MNQVAVSTMKPEQHKHFRHSILIAEPNYLFRKGLRALFGSEIAFQPTREVASEEELLASIQQSTPDILLVSEELLQNNVIAELLRVHCPEMKVVCLTADPPGHIDLNRLPGADLLIARSHAPVKLLEQVKNLICPEPSASRQTSDLHALVANHQEARTDVLTSREKEVVRLLSEGLTVREAAADLGLSCKTVEAHTLNLMRKLDIHDRSTLISFALASGMADARVAV